MAICILYVCNRSVGIHLPLFGPVLGSSKWPYGLSGSSYLVLPQWQIATSQSFYCFSKSCINGIMNLTLKHCWHAYNTVFWNKWSSLLRSSNSWRGWSWRSSCKPRDQLRIRVISYKRIHDFLNATMYSCGHEAYGYLWKKVNISLSLSHRFWRTGHWTWWHIYVPL